jgi:hypothetical protein
MWNRVECGQQFMKLRKEKLRDLYRLSVVIIVIVSTERSTHNLLAKEIVPVLVMKACCRTRDVAPFIFSLGTRKNESPAVALPTKTTSIIF